MSEPDQNMASSSEIDGANSATTSKAAVASLILGGLSLIFSCLAGLAFVSSSASGSLLIDLVSSFVELLIDISDLLRVSSEPLEASDLLYWVMPVGLSSPSGSCTD